MIACFFLFFPLSSRAEKKNKEETMIRPPMPESLAVVAYIGTKTEIDLRKNGTGKSIWKILRLTAKELHASQVDMNGNLIEYQLRLRE